MWQVRIEANRALLDLEFHSKGIDAALLLFIKYVEEEPSLKGCASFLLRVSIMFKNFSSHGPKWYFFCFHLILS